MGSRPGTSEARGPSKADANEVAEGRAILDGAVAGFTVGATKSVGGRGAGTGAGATKG